jgi:serine phosphatase RsbU (regulator of sigma subunit)
MADQLDEVYRVLVVDDDRDIAGYVRVLLQRRAGCEVTAINDPRDAPAAAAKFRPDVLVTDIEMPGITGLELIGMVRAVAPGLPVVVMTAHASVDYAVQALRNEADEFVEKPIVAAHMVETVRRLAGEYRQLQYASRDELRAAEVQRGLQPAPIADLEGYQLAGACVPTRAVGGDFYDWYRHGDELIITLADVMGKGAGAAIIAATVRSVLHGTAESPDLAAAMSRADRELQSDLDRATSFVTLFHGALEPSTGLLRYVDAGHGLSTVCRRDGSVKRLATTSLPLGLGLHETWREHRLTLEPGDTLVSVSDGILDLFDGTLASLDEVEAITRRAPDARAAVDAIVEKAGSTAPDDVTLVVLRRLP